MTQDTESKEDNYTPTDPDNLCGRIIRVPDSICGTGFIKIVGVNTEQNTQLNMRWDFKARCYDPLLPDKHYSWFDVTKDELMSWLKETSDE